MNKAFLYKAVNFIRKYKLLHIIFWIWSFNDLVHLQRLNNSTLKQAIHDSAAIKAGQICCVYFLVYFLMPRYLYTARYLRFIISVFLLIPLSGLFTISLQELDKWVRLGRWMNPKFLPVLYIAHIVELLMISGFFFAVYAVQYTFQTERRNRKLEKEKLESELNFLKAQINPHFLFNSINSVYVLIDEDKKLARETLLKFSGLLRYQLYDCSNNYMPLERELEFIKDYIDLELVRSGNDVLISFETVAYIPQLDIAPFLLVPFVENAFKHRSRRKTGNWVSVKCTANDNVFSMEVTNSRDPGAENKPYGGIGLQNVKRRLTLLYPGKHTLNITKTEYEYNVNLQLILNENTMHISRR